MSHELVWYVAYGSNLAADRMLAYLVGGGGDRPWGHHRGAADPTPPRDDRRVVVPHPVFFGGHSRRWGGGCCFCPAEPPPDGALPVVGRAWLMTRGQLSDVVAQENGAETSAVALPDPLPGPGEAVHVLDGWIDLLLCMDPVDGHPSVTLGSTNPPPPGPPSPTYRAVLATGMAEMGLTPDEAETHLVDLDRR
ncbi:MAG: hypothetical protein CL459_02325 [Acidimicrobiaceae bacterium]|nr:hypothetical protein [Acidimicrobiaceae bacterium]